MIKVKICAPYSRYYGQEGIIENAADITLTDFIGADLARVRMNNNGLKLTFNTFEFEGKTEGDKSQFWYWLRRVRGAMAMPV